MMKNNQMFQRLGLSTLASMINNTSSKSKDDVSQESGSLYDLRIVRALNKRRLARYTFFSALQCLSYDYYLCPMTIIFTSARIPIFASYLVLFCQFRIPRLLRVYVKIHPTLLATSLLEDLEDLREW